MRGPAALEFDRAHPLAAIGAKYISRWRKADGPQGGAANNKIAVALLLKLALHMALRERVAQQRRALEEHVANRLASCVNAARTMQGPPVSGTRCHARVEPPHHMPRGATSECAAGALLASLPSFGMHQHARSHGLASSAVVASPFAVAIDAPVVVGRSTKDSRTMTGGDPLACAPETARAVETHPLSHSKLEVTDGNGSPRDDSTSPLLQTLRSDCHDSCEDALVCTPSTSRCEPSKTFSRRDVCLAKVLVDGVASEDRRIGTTGDAPQNARAPRCLGLATPGQNDAADRRTEGGPNRAAASSHTSLSAATTVTEAMCHRYLCDFVGSLTAAERAMFHAIREHSASLRAWMKSRALSFDVWTGIDLPSQLRGHEFSSDPNLEIDQRNLLDDLIATVKDAASAAAPTAAAAAKLVSASDMPAALRKNRALPFPQKVVRHVFAGSTVQLEAARPPLLGGRLADGDSMARKLARTLGLHTLAADISEMFAEYDRLVERGESRRVFRIYLQNGRRGAAQNGLTMGCRSACCMAIDGENGSVMLDYLLDAAFPFLVVEEVTKSGPPAIVVHSNYLVALAEPATKATAQSAHTPAARPVLVCDNLEAHPSFRVQTATPSPSLARAHNAVVDNVLAFVREWQGAVGLPIESELCIGRTLNTFKLTKVNLETRQLMHVDGAHEEKLTVSVPVGCLRADVYLDSYGGKYIPSTALKSPTALPFDLVPLPPTPLKRPGGLPDCQS